MGTVSETSAATLGMDAPNPNPVRSRSKLKVRTPSAAAVSNVVAANDPMAQTITYLRPNLSPSGPPSSAPTPSPISPAVTAGASCAVPIAQSSFNAADKNPTTVTSKPSTTMQKKHSTRVRR